MCALRSGHLENEQLTKFRSIMEIREISAGMDWMAVSFGDAHLPRCVLCTGGSSFLGLMEVSRLATLVECVDSDPDADPKAMDLTRIADELASLSLEQLVRHGGHYMILHEGEGAYIPQGWMFFQCCSGYMQADAAYMKRNKLAKGGCGVNFLVPRLQWTKFDALT